MRGVLVVLLCVQLSGCSFLFVRGAPGNIPPDQLTRQNVHCTASRWAPTLDGVLAGMNVAGAVINGVMASQQSGQDQEASTIAAGINGGIAGLLLISAITGATRTGRCREMLALADKNETKAERARQLEASLGTRAPLPRQLTPVPPATPRALAPMRCVADVDCGAGKMCELGQCMPLQVAP